MSAGDAHTGGLRHHAYYSPYHFLLGGSALNVPRLVLEWSLCLRLVGVFRRRKGERRGRHVPWKDSAIGCDQLGRGECNGLGEVVSS